MNQVIEEIQRKIITFFEDNCLLTDILHGFYPRRSYLAQIRLHFEWALKRLLEHSNVDFTKVLGKVWHFRMLYSWETGKAADVLASTTIGYGNNVNRELIAMMQLQISSKT